MTEARVSEQEQEWIKERGRGREETQQKGILVVCVSSEGKTSARSMKAEKGRKKESAVCVLSQATCIVFPPFLLFFSFSSCALHITWESSKTYQH